VDELDTCWRQLAMNSSGGSMVDLTGVTFVDAKGKALLIRMWERGAEFRAAGCLTRCLVEEITKATRTGSSRVSQKGG
jgi:ABC-type transporter Mla MlaB component